MPPESHRGSHREQRKRLAVDVSFLESPAVDIPLRVVVLGKPPLNGPRGEVSIRLPGDRTLKCLHPKPIIEAAITEALLAAPIALDGGEHVSGVNRCRV